jgi:hypothetical protein
LVLKTPTYGHDLNRVVVEMSTPRAARPAIPRSGERRRDRLVDDAGDQLGDCTSAAQILRFDIRIIVAVGCLRSAFLRAATRVLHRSVDDIRALWIPDHEAAFAHENVDVTPDVVQSSSVPPAAMSMLTNES